MLLKQKRETKLGEEYWRERMKAIIKCIGVVSSQEFYNPHYTWIRCVYQTGVRCPKVAKNAPQKKKE